ncbi:MAG TPA: helicase-associated domain-containing protein [Jatrophihabitans sp.]|uniref:helicase-associated domain-containing protein n=1 Tax=Jatrophihabitans sp. TaxID=1932789 RepID=UPI002EEE3F2B
MTAQPQALTRAGAPQTLTEWLRGWTDAQLVTLLRRRPDLALPAPVDLSSLASRASVRTSISRALDGLDAFTLRTLEVLVCAGPDASLAAVQAWFRPELAADVAAALDRLAEWALIWGDAERLHPVGTVREVLGPYPAGLGRRAADLFATVNDIALAPLLRQLGLPPATQPRSGSSAAAAIEEQFPRLLAECSPAERSILDRLAAGPPIGALRNALHGGLARGDADNPARNLLDLGLLAPIDNHTVELPRELGLALRSQPAGEVSPRPPEIEAIERGGAVIDGGGCTQVLDTVRLVELLLNEIAADPPSLLRAGGLGVRELRRLSRALDAAEPVTALLVEVAYEAGLLSHSTTADPVYLPTTEFDSWLRRGSAERWVQLATAWLSMTRLPSLVGARDDRDKSIAALSADAERHSAPALRLQLLGLLAELPPGLAPGSDEQVLARLGWQAPRRASASRKSAASMLGEAAVLGLTGYGALTGYTRALLHGAETGAAQAEANATHALTAALPEAVEDFLLQPDLTAVVPGPPAPDLQRELNLVADLESTGGASVYRIGPVSLRRALDAGRTGSDLQQFFASRSRTPVPQALQYLINDVATQHGRLRTGTATSYLRCDDEALLNRVLTDPALESLGLVRIAPTVLISSAAISTVLERLRRSGFSPAAESADGAVVSLSADSPRVPGRQHSRISRIRASTIGESQLVEVVNRLRASERLAAAVTNATSRVSQQVPGVTSASILELLRTAVREELQIAIGYVDDTGTPSQRTLLPISLGGGMLRGHDPEDGRLRSYPLQRITTVSLLDE